MIGRRLEGLGNASNTQSVRQAILSMQGNEAIIAVIIGNMTNADAIRYGFANNPKFADAQKIAFQLKTAFIESGEGSEEDFNKLLISLPAFKQVVSMVSNRQLRGLGDDVRYPKANIDVKGQVTAQDNLIAEQRAADAEKYPKLTPVDWSGLIKTTTTSFADIATAGSKADIANAEAARANYELQAAQLRSGTTQTGTGGSGSPPKDDDKILGLPKMVVYIGVAALGLGLVYGLTQLASDDKPAPQPAKPAKSEKALSGFKNKSIKKSAKKGVKTYTF
jgi:hypothetical protein